MRVTIWVISLLNAAGWAQPNQGVTLSLSVKNTFCVGCPDYQVDFSETGQVALRCTRGCAIPGEQHYSVPQQRFREVLKEFYFKNFLAIPRVDESRFVSDVPINRLVYRDERYNHEVVDVGRNDSRVKSLEKQMVEATGVERYWKPSVALYQQLLDSGWAINTLDEDGENALFVAVLMDERASVEFLLQHGSTISERTLVMASRQNTAILHDLIVAVPLKPTDDVVRSMVVNAARDAKSNTLQFLLDFGADVNLREPSTEYSQDYTPLLAAITNDAVENASLLLGKGANVNARDRSGRSALWHVSAQRPDLIEFLVHHGANVNLPDNLGTTPLMRASGACNPEAVRALLSAGADPRIMDNRGRTALRNSTVPLQKCNEAGTLVQDAWNAWGKKPTAK